MVGAVCAARVVGVACDCGFSELRVYLVDACWYVATYILLVGKRKETWQWANIFITVIALVLTITNTLAFSRCDKFSQATGFASNAMYGSGLARNLAGGMISSIFNRR